MDIVPAGGLHPPPVPATTPWQPRLSIVLADLVRRMSDPHPDVGIRDIVLPDWLRPEAQAALVRHEQLLSPCEGEVVFAWLKGVNAGLAQPLAMKDLIERARDLGDVLGSFPFGVFHSGTRREAQLTFQWFPGAKELNELLTPHAIPYRATQRALAALIATEPLPMPEPKPAPEVREAQAEEFRRRIAEVLPTYAEDKPAPSEAKPRYLTREQLTASYLRQADTNPNAAAAARARLAMLAGDKERSWD